MNNKIAEGLAKANEVMVFYDIAQAEGEYQIINLQTGIVEVTTTILPEALFQARHLDDMLQSLLSDKAEVIEGEDTEAPVSEDILLN